MIREYTRSMTANIQKNTASNLKSKRFLLLILMLIGCGTFALQTLANNSTRSNMSAQRARSKALPDLRWFATVNITT